ncbi:MMPL family transporter [Methylocaldum sp. MU1018]
MRERLPVFAWLVLMAIGAWIALFRTPVSTDLTHFLPKKAGIAEQILVEQLRQGVASRLMLVALEGGNETDLAEISRQLAERLRNDASFARVDNGSQGLSAADRDFLFRNRYLLSPEVGARRFGSAGLRRALEARLTELASPAGLLEKEFLPRDPTGEFLETLRPWMASRGPSMRRGVWFSPDGRRALLVAETKAPAFDLDAQAEAVASIRNGFAAIRGSRPVDLLLGGPGVFSVEANATITQDAARLSLLNTLAITLLLAAVFRSLRVILLGLVPLATGALAGTCAVSLWSGGIHGITLGFGATLIGVAADYPNHLFAHVRREETSRQTVRLIWPTLRLGILTNVAGFAAMLFSGFEGLSQLGVFAATGLLAAGLTCRWIMPALMPEHIDLPDRIVKGLRADAFLDRLYRFRWVPPMLILAATVSIAGSGASLWNDDIDALSPVPESRKALDEALRRDLGAPDLRQLIVVTGGDAESVLRRSERLQGILKPLVDGGTLAGFDMAALYLPSRETQSLRQSALPEAAALRRNLDEALRETSFKRGAFEPFLADASQAKRAPLLDQASFAGTTFRLKIESLLFRHGDLWIALVPLVGVADAAHLQAALAAEAGNDVIYLDLREASSRLLRGYRREAVHLLGASLVAIVILLTAGLRSVGGMLRVLTPMAAAAFVAAAVLMRQHGGLSLYHLVSLLLVMGLGMDQALFFNKPGRTPEERNRTFLSLLICSFSAVTAFGILATSKVNILNAIGSTVAMGAALAVLFAAMLARRNPSSA